MVRADERGARCRLRARAQRLDEPGPEIAGAERRLT